MKKSEKKVSYWRILVLVVFGILAMVAGFYWYDNYKRSVAQREAYDKLATDPIMSKELLGAKFDSQVIRGESHFIKHNKAEVTNYYKFTRKISSEEIKNDIVKRLKDGKWDEIEITEWDANFYIKAYKESYYIKISIPKKFSQTIYLNIEER